MAKKKVAKKKPVKAKSKTKSRATSAEMNKATKKAATRADKPFGSVKVGAKNLANTAARGAPGKGTKAGKAGKKAYQDVAERQLADIKKTSVKGRKKIAALLRKIRANAKK